VDRARILLIDDNELLLKLTAKMLTPSFDVVGVANDGRDLASKALRLQPDVIVADITMPNGDRDNTLAFGGWLGYQDRISDRRRGEEYVQACLEERALGYVVKSDINDVSGPPSTLRYVPLLEATALSDQSVRALS
jgi:CheY-like chemotaxis protein